MVISVEMTKMNNMRSNPYKGSAQKIAICVEKNSFLKVA